MFYRMIVCGYLMPWPDCSEKDQHWEQRSEEFKKFTNTFTMDLKNLCASQDLVNNKEIQVTYYKNSIPLRIYTYVFINSQRYTRNQPYCKH